MSAAWRARGPALRIGIIGVLVPLAVGSGLSFLLPDSVLADPERRIIFALFLGTTMAISAMVIIARVLHDLDLVKSDLGLVTLCGYAVNDILAWIVFSLVLAVATSAALNLGAIAFLLVFTFAFTAFALTLGLRLVDGAVARIGTRMSENPGAVLTFVCCLGLASGALTQAVGLTALFGFFLAGIMAGEARHLTERTREIIGQMVHSIFVPLYFAGLALHLDFIANFNIGLVAFVTVVSIAAKFGGAWLGALGRDISAQDRVVDRHRVHAERGHRHRGGRRGAGVPDHHHAGVRGHRVFGDRLRAAGGALAVLVDPAPRTGRPGPAAGAARHSAGAARARPLHGDPRVVPGRGAVHPPDRGRDQRGGRSARATHGHRHRQGRCGAARPHSGAAPPGDGVRPRSGEAWTGTPRTASRCASCSWS